MTTQTTKQELSTLGFECRSGHSNPGKFKFLIVFHSLPEISHVVDEDAFKPTHIYLKNTLETRWVGCILGHGQSPEEAWKSAIKNCDKPK